MSLGISNVNTVNIQSIDYAAIKDVTEQILNRQDSKSIDLNTLDLSKFQKAELGKDFYSGTINPDVAKQIALRSTGLDMNLNQSFIANLQYLNAKAGEIAYAGGKNVEGKIHIPTAQAAQQEREVIALPKSTTLESTKDLDKDPKGSNPFFGSEFLNNENKQNQNDEPISIFS